MYRGGADAWNIRDRHMADTLAALLEDAGPDAKAIVWAHNSHVGDARHTEMGRMRGELNLGELCRDAWPGDTAIVGFGTHEGTVAAADDWDEPMRVMAVRPSRPDSVEHLFHRTAMPRLLADLRADGGHDSLHTALQATRLQRFIGVIYRPGTERYSHYAEASLSRQFDAYAWFDHTRAVQATPHESERAPGGVPDTWPFAV
jgi:erythromycin esterase-like protein